MNKSKSIELAVPHSLQSEPGKILPTLSYETISQLTEAGWSKVGLIVPLITRDSNLLMFKHNEVVQTTNGKKKVRHGMLGPLGETSKGVHPVIEQPLETLHRGIEEETGTREPSTLGLRARTIGGWFVNHWPVGVEFPDEYACAICPPIYVPPAAEERLLAHQTGNEEISGIYAMSPSDIKDTDPARLRPGVIGWLAQLEATDFLKWPGDRTREVDFSSVFASGMTDLDLQKGH
ncbi:hypothetical protein H7097_00430 [Aeromicrobium sp.]|nr:hypothetical protein [Candidatus Saccharibacteria bacterium]